MTANELADELKEWIDEFEDFAWLTKHETMLRSQSETIASLQESNRQQQAEIIELECEKERQREKYQEMLCDKDVEIEALKKEIQNQSLNDLMDWQQELDTANTCKHGVDDGACKECYQEATHPAKTLTDEEIEQIGKEYGIKSVYQFAYYEFARAILRKAQEK